MSTTRHGPSTPKDVWKSVGGQGWVATQALIDETYRPLEERLVDAAVAASARRVLDVGCGTGATTVAMARRLGAGARCVGIDISEAMIDAARARAVRERVPATFICDDAETHAFEAESLDMIVSRFGVMFFDDPVRAFANLRGAASSGAALRCIVWRGADENPFMTAAERAAEPLLPGISRRVPDEPGQFGFADPDRVRDHLTRSGWQGIDITAIDVPCSFPASELDLYLSRLGPVGRALEDADDRTRTRVLEAVRPAFDPYVQGDEVGYSAACWEISARAGARDRTR